MGASDSRTVRYSLMQALYWMIFGIVIAYAPVYLPAKGFSLGTVGILIAAASTAGALLQPVVGSMADRSHTLSLSRLSAFLCLPLIAAGIGTVFFGRIGTLLSSAVMICAITVILPLVNSVGMYYNRCGLRCDYGTARAMGSLAFAGVSLGMNTYIGWFGAGRIPLAAAALSGLFLALLLSSPTPPGLLPTTMEPADEADTGSARAFLDRYPGFFLILSAVVLIFGFHTLTSTYLIQLIRHVGGSERELGLTMGLAAVVELPAMIFFLRLEKRFGSAAVLKASGLFWVMKALAYALSAQVSHIYGAQLFHALSFAPFMPALVYYSHGRMRDSDQVKGQSLMTTANTLGGVLGNTAGGFLADRFGVPVLLIAGVLLAMAGSLALFGGIAGQRRAARAHT